MTLLLLTSCQDRSDEAAPGPQTSLTILVTGDDFNWHHRYPGADGELETGDDILVQRNLHVPVNTRTKLLLASRDYVYTLALPHLDLKEVAIPGLSFFLEFQEDALGTYPLLGDQLCGYTHPNLLGKLIVEPREDFESWLVRQEKQAPGREPSVPANVEDPREEENQRSQ